MDQNHLFHFGFLNFMEDFGLRVLLYKITVDPTVPNGQKLH